MSLSPPGKLITHRTLHIQSWESKIYTKYSATLLG